MNIYVMRHGTTVWNEIGRVQGWSKNRLSIKGKNLCNKQAEVYKNTPFDIFIVSPIMRTMQSANIMHKYHTCPIIRDNRLAEWDQGVFTGRFKSTFTEEEKRIRALRLKEYGMENKHDIYVRCLDFVEHLKEQNYKNVLIVTHAAIGYYVYCILQGIKEEDIDYSKSKFANAEVKKVTI